MGYLSTRELALDVAEILREGIFTAVEGYAEGPVFKCRLWLDEETFVHVYFNEDTGTTAFVLVWRESRVFGIDFDRIRGWHMHPFDKPESHRPFRQTRLTEFMRFVSAWLRARRRLTR